MTHQNGRPDAGRITPAPVLARNATLNLLAQGWILLVLMLAIPRLVSYLGAPSFGLFSLAWAIIGYLSLLDIGVSRAATKFISERLVKQDGESIRHIVRTAVTANLLIGLAGGLGVILICPYLIHSVFKISVQLQGQARLAFYAAGVAVPVFLLQGVFWAVLGAFQKFGWTNAIDALATAAQWSAACILAWKGQGAGWVACSAVAARIVATAVCGLVVVRTVPALHFFSLSRLQGLGKLLRFGGWVTVSQVASSILFYLDRVLIASFTSLSAVTLYTVPFEVAARIQIIPMSLAGTLYPAFSERGSQNARHQLQPLYERSLRYLVVLVVPCVLYLLVLGPDLFSIWMSPPFAQQTSKVVRILALGALANSLAYLPYSLLQALGRADLPGKFHLLELPLFLATSAVLVWRWGIVGAATAGTLRFAVDCALLFWAAGRYLQCSLRRFWTGSFLRILTLTVLLVMLLLVIHLRFTSPWVRLALGLSTMGISLYASWRFVVDRADQSRFGQALQILLGRPAARVESLADPL
jgi:O-antigen/teichoic acid export membrane protein